MKKLFTLILALALTACACLSLIGCGTATYKDLKIVELGAETEAFGIAFRKGSNVTRKVENAIAELVEEGKLSELAQTYGVGGVASYKPAANENNDSTDWAKIQSANKLVVGITDYKPMDYRAGGSDEWIGYDADLARMVCEKLSLEVEFKEIVWDNKLLELQSGTIDCIWNGMTITDEILRGADCSVPYMENRQVAVVLKSKEDIVDVASMANKRITAENGSAGEKVIKANSTLSKNYISVESQADAFLEVISGKSEIAVVDLMMARALIEG